MKINKIMFVGAAFLMMISCDTNSVSFDKLKDINTSVSHLNSIVAPLPLNSPVKSFSSLEGRYDF